MIEFHKNAHQFHQSTSSTLKEDNVPEAPHLRLSYLFSSGFRVIEYKAWHGTRCDGGICIYYEAQHDSVSLSFLCRAPRRYSTEGFECVPVYPVQKLLNI